jgi:hypothetical protein
MYICIFMCLYVRIYACINMSIFGFVKPVDRSEVIYFKVDDVIDQV